MRGARLKQKLAAGEPVFIASIAYHAPRLVELLCSSGASLIFLDAELVAERSASS
jgi:hypothetical protein